MKNPLSVWLTNTSIIPYYKTCCALEGGGGNQEKEELLIKCGTAEGKMRNGNCGKVGIMCNA